MVQHIGKQQVVNVRAVARREHQRVGGGEVHDALQPMHRHAVVDAAPEPSQEAIHEPHGREGHVGGNGKGCPLRPGIVRRQWHLSPRLGRDGGAHLRACQNPIDEGATVGEIRA